MSPIFSQREEINEALREIFRQLGLKLTHQRMEIFNIISSLRNHPSAEDVFDAVKERMPTIAFDTVYRTLTMFERNGLISRVHYIDGRQTEIMVIPRTLHPNY